MHSVVMSMKPLVSWHREFLLLFMGKSKLLRTSFPPWNLNQQVRSFFLICAKGSAGILSQLQSAVSSVASAFKDADATTMESVKELLLNSIVSDSSAVRLVAVSWSMRLFPFVNCLGRYICIVGAGDDRPEVQSEACLGLDPSTFKKETSDGAAADYPSIPRFLTFLRENSLAYHLDV